MIEPLERRRRFLSQNTEIKDDLQTIFTAAEETYSDLREVLSVTGEVEKAVQKLQTMLTDLSKDSNNSLEEGDDKLNQIIEFCSNISDSFERLVESLTAESENQEEEIKKNRTLLSNVATTYKNISNQLLQVKHSLDEALNDRKKIDLAVKDAIAKVDLIYSALQAHNPIILFFKNMKEDEIMKLLPTLQIVIFEILKEKGYNAEGVKKEPIIIILNLFLNQLKNNLIAILASLAIMWIVRGWLDLNHQEIKSGPKQYQQEIEELKKEIIDLHNTDKSIESKLGSKKKSAPKIP
jgi:chromosome segregation ATPase